MPATPVRFLDGWRWCALLLVAALSVGCAPTAPPTAPAGTTEGTAAGTPVASGGGVRNPHGLTGQQVLEKMADVYRQAQSYRDRGELRISYREGDQPIDKVLAPLRLAFARPNQMKVESYGAQLVTDGKQLHGYIEDLPEQVLETTAPEQLTLEVALQDRTLDAGLQGQIGFRNPVLGLLLHDRPLDDVLTGAEAPVLLPNQAFDGHNCFRVAVTNSGSTLVMWVDEQNFVLRRLELPMGDLKAGLDPENRWQDFKLSADFRQAELNKPAAADWFTFVTPAEAAVVKRFVPARRPSPPSELLGKQLPELKLQTLDGKPTSLAEFKDKLVVIEVWATWCGWCLKQLPETQRIADQFAGKENVAFLALNNDDADITSAQVAETLAKIGVKLPVLRDSNSSLQAVVLPGAERLPLPLLLVVDASGVVQLVEFGYNEELAKTLPDLIDTIRAGKNHYQEVQQRYAEAVRQYEQTLLAAAIEDPTDAANPNAAAAIAPFRAPEVLQLTQAWVGKDLVGPGNFFALPQPDGSLHIGVVDGIRAAVELDTTGKVLATHDLGLGDGALCTTIRTAIDGKGKRWFIGTAPGQPQVYLFDENWKLIQKHPAEGQPQGVSDILLSDFRAPGEVDALVGYYDDIGLHAVSLEGERRWVFRQVQNVLNMAVSEPDAKGERQIFATNARATLLVLNAKGEQVDEWFVGKTATQELGHILYRVAAADMNSDGTSELIALAQSQAGEELLVGIGPKGKELWTQPLPKGNHSQPIDPISAGPLQGQPGKIWLVASPNGSLHFFAADGKPLDRFDYGEQLTGAALFPAGDKTLLLVSSLNDKQIPKLAAYYLSVPGTAAPALPEQTSPVAEPTSKRPALGEPALEQSQAPTAEDEGGPSLGGVPRVGSRPEMKPDPKPPVTPVEPQPETPAPAPAAPEAPALPGLEAPPVEAPKPAETPKPESPAPEAPKPESPAPEAPPAEAPKPEAPAVESPAPAAPELPAPSAENPPAEPPAASEGEE